MRSMRALIGGLLVLASVFAALPAAAPAAGDVPRITKEEAKALLGKPNVVFIDARVDSQWQGSNRKIKGAVRYDRYDPDTIARDHGRDTTFIIY